MPPRGFVKPEPADRRLKVGLTVTQHDALVAKAGESGTTTAGYVRALIEFDLGERRNALKPRSDARQVALLAEVHGLAMQIKHIAMGVSSMARQLQAGRVPVTADEMRITQAHVAETMDRAVILFDKVLAR